MKHDLLSKTYTFRSGKDIADLLASKQTHSPAPLTLSPPVTETEHNLYNIWKNLLKYAGFGIHDDFFHIGGNSLKAVQLVSRISRDFSVNIQLSDVFLKPTISQLAVFIESREKSVNGSVVAIQARPEHIPLSFSQERLWFIDQLEGSVQYHTPELLRLKGKLNTGALEHALQTIVNRHEVLRTVIRAREGQAFQYIKEKDSWRLSVIDGARYIHDSTGLQQYIDEIINKPFDLSQDDMLRAHLIRLNEQDHRLVITIHHIASDGWSMSIFVKELTELYSAYVGDRPAELGVPETQYADYALWLRQKLQGDKLNEKLDYWKKQLSGVEPLLLPTDYPRPAVQSTRGANLKFIIDKGLTDQLQELSHQHGVTLFMTLLSVFKVLLYRYSGQEDICVGSPIAGRQSEEIEGLIGFFVNTLALRTEINGDVPFTELLKQVKTTTLEAYEHQDVPFEKVVEAVVKERDMSRNPLFQVMMVWQNTPEASELQLGGITLSKEEFLHNTSKFDLTYNITQTSRGIEGVVEYSTELFSEQTIKRMMGHFRQLVTSVVNRPEQTLNHLTILTTPEKHQLLVEFNNTAVQYPKESTIVSLFEEQAAKSPDRVAVVFEEQYLTYRQLNERANQLAHALRGRGVKAETMVPVCIERSLEMIVGVLAILKSGAAYVPVDPEYPEDRINYMLRDTGATIIVSAAGSSHKLQHSGDFEMIEISETWFQGSKQPTSNIQNAIMPEGLAYVLYTSGSTGKPKGVKMPGKALVNLLLWQEGQFKNKHRHVLQFASLNFDVSFQEIFSTLCFGSTLFLISSDRRKDAVELLKDIEENKITHLFVPYIVLKGITEYILNLPSVSISLEEIIVAGEQLKLTEDIQTLIKRNSIRIINQYGPTEAHVVTSHSVNDVLNLPILPPIGKPVSNTCIYILSNGTELTPIGVGGEICIGGVQVARGYLNRPDLTKEKFVADPFSKDSGRMYRTGDLGRWLPDGSIEYAGRKDDQVKIRGYRVELGEIESVLQQYDFVRQAVVLAREDGTGNKQLVGYIIGEKSFDKKAMIAYLKDRLPEYMVPGIWVEVAAFPVTHNGKVDKKALPAPDLAAELMKQYVAPRNDLEKSVTKIWEELLQISKVGINDNFFNIGGHSLMAMRVVSSISRNLEIEVGIKDLFTHPTVSQLVAHVKEKNKGLLLPAIMRQVRPVRIPLSFSQERLWFIDQLEGSLQYHLAEVFQLHGKLNKKALAFALHQIISRHEILRTVIREDETGPYQCINNNDEWHLQEIDAPEYRRNPKALAVYINELINEPFDLSRDTMLRAHLIELDEQEHKLVLTVHHIACDGWSVAILVKELAELYGSYVEERPLQLPSLALQYADYAIWQRHYLKGDLFDKKISYWKEKLQDVAPLQLPTDFTRPPIQSTNGAVSEFSINEELTEQLQQLSQQQGTTLFMTLLTAYKILLHRYSGQDDICIGTAVADRHQSEVEDLVGFFVNTLALRSTVTADSSFARLLQEVKTNTLEGYEYQEVPFEKIVEVVVKERDLSRNPLFQVMIVWQNTPPVPEVFLGDIKLTREPVAITKTKFDISFTVTETPKGLQGLVEYCSDLYTADTIGRMNAHFTRLLSSVVKNPEEKVGKLAMLLHEEERQLLENFNGKSYDYAWDKSIVELFQGWATHTPDNVAIASETQELTYGQLNKRANQVAHYLRGKGVKEEVMVPICLNRSIEMVIGVLGILKAGGAYVPIDPDYPDERITYMLEDTTSNIVISTATYKSKLQTSNYVDIIELDRVSWADIEMQSGENLKNVVEPHHLAYVIYTSGSTGRPKGVMIEHSSVVNLVSWHNNEFSVTPSSRATSMAGVGFDAFGWEIWPYLCAGASIFLIDDIIRLQAGNLLKLFQLKRISHSFISTALVHEFVSETRNKDNSLEFVLTGGDKLSPLDVRGLRYKVVNNYGPTEYTVVTSSYLLTGKEVNNTPPIGKPIANTTIRILNDQNSLVPVGVAGEVCVGGGGLARGYLNLDELTASKFVEVQSNAVITRRMYKTGDLGRWLPDGNIEYVGRKDDQVKIRGNRIELGEIENVILQSGWVNQALVLVRDKDNGDKFLVAYIVPTQLFDKHKMSSYLQTKLPKYMIPASWVELQTLPLTPNGKINKKALPEPTEENLAHHQYVAPITETEVKLADIWKELLHLEQVGLYDNFFDLGGHSLLAKRVASYIERKLLISIPIQALFQFTSIRELGKYLDIQLNVYQQEKDSVGFKFLSI